MSAHADGLTVNGERYTQEQVDFCKARLAALGVSPELGVDRDMDMVALGLLGAYYGKGAR